MIDNYVKPSAILIAQRLNQGSLPLVPDGTKSLKDILSLKFRRRTQMSADKPSVFFDNLIK